MTDRTIIQELTTKWTDKSRLLKPTVVFQKIRDIPYMLFPELMNSWEGALKMLKRNCGSCSPKHFLMARILREMNIETYLVTFPFLWQAQEIAFPEKLQGFLPELPISYHVACRIRIEDKSVDVDATFDPPLKRGGFVVNDWDGESDTQISVVYTDEILHESEEERSEYVMRMRDSIPDEKKRLEAQFHKQLNAWFRGLREYPSTDHI
jgi:hypothetical protein